MPALVGAAEEIAAGTDLSFCAWVYFVVAHSPVREGVVVYIDRGTLTALRSSPPPM